MFFFCSHKVNPRCRGATYTDTFYCVETGTQKLSCLLESKLRNEFNHDTASLDGTTGAGSSAVEASIVVTSRTAQGIGRWFHRACVC